MDKLKTLSRSILLFVAVFILAQLVLVNCFGLGATPEKTDGNIHLQTIKNKYPIGKLVAATITNGTNQEITIANHLPEPPLTVHKLVQNQLVVQTPQYSDSIDFDAPNNIKIPSGKSIQLDFKNWNNQLFGETGTYQLSFETELDNKTITIHSAPFQIEEPGIFRQIWTGLIYRPIYNALIFFSSYAPGHNLGVGIILLTILIRTILLAPAGKAMKSQRKMAEIQPKLQQIKEKYKGDQQRIAAETMVVWKEAKVNPTGTCLPLLLQFPFLIAIFYAVQNGINPDNQYLLYTTYNNVSLADIQTSFLGLDLLKQNAYILPLIVGGLQFLQLKLVNFHSKKKKNKLSVSKEMQTANTTMTYILPVLIAVFTASLPAGVGIYWGTSTLYGIIQQIFINRSSDSEASGDVKVKVIKSS